MINEHERFGKAPEKSPYQLVDLGSLANKENLKDSYWQGDEIQVLKDVLPVEWVAEGENKDFNIDESGFWFVVFNNEGKVYLMNNVHTELTDGDLNPDRISTWIDHTLEHAKAFPDRQHLIDWLKAQESTGSTDSKMYGTILAEIGA